MNDQLVFPIRSDKLSLSAKVLRRIDRRVSPYQTIEILETESLGRVLLLDGHIQLSTFDEFAYHEALVHIPLLSIEAPVSALVVGGGDGGTVRELVKHSVLQRIDMVDIDAEVIAACREHLPTLNGGAFEDPRVTLHIADAFEFVKNSAHLYDLVVMDATDVYEEESGELSERLWTRTFFEDVKRVLKPHGFLVSQADNHVFCPYSMEAVLEEFGAVFEHTGSYQALVPSFGGYSGYVWASPSGELQPQFPSAVARNLSLKYLTAATYALALEWGRPGGIFLTEPRQSESL